MICSDSLNFGRILRLHGETWSPYAIQAGLLFLSLPASCSSLEFRSVPPIKAAIKAELFVSVLLLLFCFAVGSHDPALAAFKLTILGHAGLELTEMHLPLCPECCN